MIDKPAIGLIAMGKKENLYLWQDLIDRFGPDIDVMFRGVLDGFEPEEIRERFAFSEGDHYIVTELPDKSTVHISERAARDQVSGSRGNCSMGERQQSWCCVPVILKEAGQRRECLYFRKIFSLACFPV